MTQTTLTTQRMSDILTAIAASRSPGMTKAIENAAKHESLRTQIYDFFCWLLSLQAHQDLAKMHTDALDFANNVLAVKIALQQFNQAEQVQQASGLAPSTTSAEQQTLQDRVKTYQNLRIDQLINTFTNELNQHPAFAQSAIRFTVMSKLVNDESVLTLCAHSGEKQACVHTLALAKLKLSRRDQAHILPRFLGTVSNQGDYLCITKALDFALFICRDNNLNYAILFELPGNAGQEIRQASDGQIRTMQLQPEKNFRSGELIDCYLVDPQLLDNNHVLQHMAHHTLSYFHRAWGYTQEELNQMTTYVDSGVMTLQSLKNYFTNREKLVQQPASSHPHHTGTTAATLVAHQYSVLPTSAANLGDKLADCSQTSAPATAPLPQHKNANEKTTPYTSLFFNTLLNASDAKNLRMPDRPRYENDFKNKITSLKSALAEANKTTEQANPNLLVNRFVMELNAFPVFQSSSISFTIQANASNQGQELILYAHHKSWNNLYSLQIPLTTNTGISGQFIGIGENDKFFASTLFDNTCQQACQGLPATSILLIDHQNNNTVQSKQGARLNCYLVDEKTVKQNYLMQKMAQEARSYLQQSRIQTGTIEFITVAFLTSGAMAKGNSTVSNVRPHTQLLHHQNNIKQ